MNRNSVIVTALIAILLIGGIWYFAMRKDTSPTTTVNTNVEQPTTNNTTSNTTSKTKEPGVPTVSTKATSYASSSNVVMNGSVNPNGVQTSYWYEYGLSNSLGSFTPAQLIGSGYLTYGAPTVLGGLSANTIYSYRIGAQNQYGKVYGEILTFKTTNTAPLPRIVPKAETNAATDISTSGVTLNGTTNPNGSMTSTWFEYGLNTSLGNSVGAKSAGDGNTNSSVSISLSGLNSNTTYYYRFNAQNSYGTVNGNIFSFTTKGVNPTPVQGTAPTAETTSSSNVSKTDASVRGQINPNSSATSYYFEYGKSSLFGLFVLDQKTDPKSLGSGTKTVPVSSNISSLDADSTYYYRVVATNAFGTTSGAILSFTTKK